MNTKYGGPGMRVKRLIADHSSGFIPLPGRKRGLAAQADQDKKDQPAAQSEESTKAKGADQEKTQQDDKQPQPANVPVIKKDEGC
jgi:hypothetical protein